MLKTQNVFNQGDINQNDNIVGKHNCFINLFRRNKLDKKLKLH